MTVLGSSLTNTGNWLNNSVENLCSYSKKPPQSAPEISNTWRRDPCQVSQASLSSPKKAYESGCNLFPRLLNGQGLFFDNENAQLPAQLVGLSKIPCQREHHDRRPSTTNPISTINTITYESMVAARIGIRSKGFNTYHTVQSSKVSLEFDSREAKSIAPSYTSSPERSSKGGLLSDLSIKSKLPIRAFGRTHFLDEYCQPERVNSMKETLKSVIIYFKGFYRTENFQAQNSMFRIFYPYMFWTNYKHLETEIIIFHEDREFLRASFYKTCQQIIQKVILTDRLLRHASYCKTEYIFLSDQLKHICYQTESIGWNHHESFVHSAERNLSDVENSLLNLVAERKKIDQLRFEADRNLYGLRLCLEVNVHHKNMAQSILCELKWFHDRYLGSKKLMPRYFRPLFIHFHKIKDSFCDETFLALFTEFQTLLMEASKTNMRAHEVLNEMAKIRKTIPHLLRKARSKLRRAQEVNPGLLIVRRLDEDVRPAHHRDTEPREYRRKARSLSPERKVLSLELYC